jgi:hypothetical protein
MSHDTPHDDSDPLARLSAAWQQQEIPEATPELDECDADTQAVVEWMRVAWEAQPIPAARPPQPVRWPLRLVRNRPWPELTRYAAAALLLVSLTLAVVQRPGSTAAPAASDSASRHEFATGTEAVEPADDTAPRLVAVASDQITFRSGPVRLVLITDHSMGE